MSNNVIDIIERFQTRHALQEEQEMKNFNASRNGAPTQGVPDKNAMPSYSRVETQKASTQRKSKSMEKK
jgi:hypothetical protein